MPFECAATPAGAYVSHLTFIGGARLAHVRKVHLIVLARSLVGLDTWAAWAAQPEVCILRWEDGMRPDMGKVHFFCWFIEWTASVTGFC